jgi:hypothetical protein
MLVESLQAAIAADATIQSLVGTTATRSDSTNGIFPILAPEEVPVPYVVMSQVSGEPLEESYQGTGRLQSTRWRFSCYGSTYKSAKVVARALKQVLISLNGPQAAGNAQVEGSWLKLEADDAEPIPHGTLYATHVDFEINFKDND